MCLCACTQWPEEGIESPVAEVAGDCEPSRRILGTELGSFEESEVLLTALAF